MRPQVDSAWLLRIAQNVCLTRLRSSGRRARLERVQDVELLEETVAAPTHHGDELIGLTDALASLPEQQRRAILLREWQGLSYAEVAARLELTQSAVETLIFRARRSLAAALENPGKRRRLRFAHALDVAGLFAAVKGFFAGSASAKIAAAVVVAATTATVAATDPAGVWRDHDTVPAGPVAAEQSEATRRSSAALPLAAASAQSHSDAAEREFYAMPGGPALDRGKRFGQATADAAKAKAAGKGKALGHAKQAEKTKASNGQGVSGGGRPEFAGTQGPPPHASTQEGAGQGAANGQATAQSQASDATSEASAKGAEASQSKAANSAKSAKSAK